MCNTWKNPKSFFLILRCAKYKYGKSFFEKGEVRFSTPQSWVNYALTNGDGRGDQLEGSIASYNKKDKERKHVLNEKYKYLHKDLYIYKIGNQVYIKNKRSMDLPCLCFYELTNDMFPIPKECGPYEGTAKIPAEYFKNFADNLSCEEIGKLTVDDKPSVIIINDFDQFKNRLIDKLIYLGLSEEEIITCRIGYKTLINNIGFDVYSSKRKTPDKTCIDELMIKDIKFKHQNEIRIIINTAKIDIINFLINNCIQIGSLSDISQAYYEYFDDGITIKINCNAKLV